MTRAILLKESGTVPEENERLYKIFRSFAIIEFKLLRKKRGMLNGPEAFPAWRLKIVS